MTIQPRAGGEVVGTTIRLPVELRNEMKIQAIRMGRSFNTHIVMILKEAAGATLGGTAPAAVNAPEQNHSEASSHAAD